VPEHGASGDPATDPVSLARAALAAARAAARRAPSAKSGRAYSAGAGSVASNAPLADSGPPPGSADSQSSSGIRTSGGVSAATSRRGVRPRRPAARPGFPAHPTGDDPQPLAAAIGGLLDDEGWTLAAATGSVFGRWAQIVGGDLAAHTTPERLTDGELTVAADSTAWATQLRLLSGQLVKRLNAEMGDGTVLRVRVTGPVTSTRQPGEWRVRGGRGPRDTYG
jgi:predicted nucleic acid-binding Zn ribbon protein